MTTDPPLPIDDSDYVLFPSVKHHQGRDRAFSDAFKAMVRFMVEVNDNPTAAYAIDKTGLVVSTENMTILSEDDLKDWDDACEEFVSIPEAKRQAWMDKVTRSYPRLEDLPEPEDYNLLH